MYMKTGKSNKSLPIYTIGRGIPLYPQKGVTYIIMLKVTAIVKSGKTKDGFSSVWTTEHIVNVCYAKIDDTSSDDDVLSVLHAESFSDSSKYTDGARLEGLARGLFITEKDADGNDVKRSCFVDGDWDATLTNVNNVLVGKIDRTAFAFRVPASELVGDPNVACLVSKSKMEIPNVPCIGYGKTEEEAKTSAVAKQSARWRNRIAKGEASVKYITQTNAEME